MRELASLARIYRASPVSVSVGTLTYGHRFPVSHRGSNDVGAVDPVSVPVGLGLIKPLSGQKLQLASISLCFLQLPGWRDIRNKFQPIH